MWTIVNVHTNEALKRGHKEDDGSGFVDPVLFDSQDEAATFAATEGLDHRMWVVTNTDDLVNEEG